MDTRGKVLFSSDKEMKPAGEGLFWFMEQPRQYGIMDSKGKIIAPAAFTYTPTFQNGKLNTQKSCGVNYVVYLDGRITQRD